MGRKKRRLKHGEKRVKYRLADGREKTIIRQVKCWAGRGKYKRRKRTEKKRGDKLRGRVSLWYRITPQDDFLQMASKRKITKEVLEELGL